MQMNESEQLAWFTVAGICFAAVTVFALRSRRHGRQKLAPTGSETLSRLQLGHQTLMAIRITSEAR
jgi:hypothetical protein